jgi:antitoxin component YwqK of YwqJK toxin-antitoxin module
LDVNKKRGRQEIEMGMINLAYENGQKFLKCEVNKYGIRHGKYTRWHENGNVLEIGEYKNALYYGKWIRYYLDGSIRDKTWYGLDGAYLGGIKYDLNGDVWMIDERWRRVDLIGCE